MNEPGAVVVDADFEDAAAALAGRGEDERAVNDADALDDRMDDLFGEVAL